MTQYSKRPMNLSQRQYENLAKAISTLTPLTLRLTNEQMDKGGGELMITNRQTNHIDKSISRGKGANLNLSATQLKKMRTAHKRGGYLVDMNKAIAGEGMYGVDAPPEMPREAGIGANLNEGEGAGLKEVALKVGNVALTGAKIVKKAVKPVIRAGLKEGCKVGTKVLANKVGVSADNPLVGAVGNDACKEAVDALLGKGVKPATKKGGRGRPRKKIA